MFLSFRRSQSKSITRYAPLVAILSVLTLELKYSMPTQLRNLQASELPGYKRSLQSCFNDGPIRGLQSTFDKLASLSVGPEKKDLEVLVIHVSPRNLRN